jgi:hypothetical protein
MSDPKQQQEQQAGDEQLAEDLTLQDEQAENVRGGVGESVSFSYGSIKHDYHPQE